MLTVTAANNSQLPTITVGSLQGDLSWLVLQCKASSSSFLSSMHAHTQLDEGGLCQGRNKGITIIYAVFA